MSPTRVYTVEELKASARAYHRKIAAAAGITDWNDADDARSDQMVERLLGLRPPEPEGPAVG